jgi:8-oxo-dGTP pyrophosphatase MutT (NUDIX family)
LRIRPTARVLLFDPDGRILLMKGRLPRDPLAPGVWFTLGGGVDEGESYEQAAMREILEETGISDARLGPLLWRSEQILSDRKNRPVLFQEAFFRADCLGGTPSREGWQDMEREFVDDIHWWELDRFAASPEPRYPADLAERARAAWSLSFRTGD